MATFKARIQSLELKRGQQILRIKDPRQMTNAELIEVITGKYPRSPADYPNDEELMALMQAAEQ
ncbi:hypothetical protein G6737_01655 [Polynucleobacter paneuropaeus]|nr:hypothetical protein [Polynucleobacter paneuropaeus]MBT8521247.1 hypothetical protein [Polynucleobacter paneuropaeus]MBT8538701.1 hypothetical protein [Polynucleobacter paneuropaeus]MBT8604396.1 hypothetical protein [Polynucleobacter paneuropaeus]RAZ47606.1 hypothetical protein DP175_05070 [Polynucleobacter paneuropaeus]